MWARFTPNLRHIITSATASAGRAGAEEVTPEHLLAAMLNDRTSPATVILENAGLTTIKLIDQIQTRQVAPQLPFAARLSERSLSLLNMAATEADRLRVRHIGSEHVALALTQTNGTRAATALATAGFTQDRALASLRAWQKTAASRLTANLSPPPRMSEAFHPVAWTRQMLRRAWGVFIGKSLGHPKFVTNPYPLYRKLRESQPIRRDPLAPVWVITTYADTLNMLRDPRFNKDPFRGERLPREMRAQLQVPIMGSARASLEMTSMLFLDPPQHTRVRSIFTKAFTPRRLESLRPQIEAITNRLLDAVKEKGEMDLLADFAAPLPVTVIAELLGFPSEDYRQIKKWSDEMAEALGLAPTVDQATRAYRAREEIRVYFELLVAKLRKEPADNLLSALLALEAQGEGLSADDLFSNSILLLAAGHETTTNLIGNGMLALFQNPDQLRDLREHPELIESAIEELLRYDAPVQWTSRIAGEDFDFAGKPIKRGEILLASVGAANRDPAVFPDPDHLDIRRPDNKHLSFGIGIHFCLGASLARMEAQIAIEALLRRMPNLRMPKQKITWRKGTTFRGLQSLRLEF